jgi:DNA-binding transcriptional ArsR family regulator
MTQSLNHRQLPTVEADPCDMPTSDEVGVASQTFQLLADRTRLQIVWALLHGERSVGSLALLVRASPSAVSQHLAKLRLAGLVRQRREGNRVFYVGDNAHVSAMLHEGLRHAEHVVEAHPDHVQP